MTAIVNVRVVPTPDEWVLRAELRGFGGRGSVTLVGADAGDRLLGAVRRLHELEQRWNRFLPDSEISALNRSEGEPLVVSADTVTLLSAMVDAWRRTGGRYDPCVLATVVDLGGAVSRVDPSHATVLPASVVSGPSPGLAGLQVENEQRRVRLPRGAAVDPSGLAKGLAADIVCEEAIAAGAIGALVELGGDLRCAGHHPDGWRIEAQSHEPDAPLRPDVEILFESGGVATSSPNSRPIGGRWAHVIDPSSGRPVETDLISVTAVAGRAWWAEAVATAGLLCVTSDRAVSFIEGHGLSGVVVDPDGVRIIPSAAAA